MESACQRRLTKTHASHVLTARGEHRASICSSLVPPIPNSQLTSHNSQLTYYKSQLTTHNSQVTTHNSTRSAMREQGEHLQPPGIRGVSLPARPDQKSGGKMEKALAGGQSDHPPTKVAAPPPRWTGMWPVCVSSPERLNHFYFSQLLAIFSLRAVRTGRAFAATWHARSQFTVKLQSTYCKVTIKLLSSYYQLASEA